MANATFGANIIPKNNTVTIGNSDSPWNIVSPNMTGTPVAPTAAAGTNTTQVATTAFVKNAVDAATTSVTFTTLGFSIATTDWSETSPYTYTFSNSIIGDNTTIDVYYDFYDGYGGMPNTAWTKVQNGTGADIKAEKVSGGVLFTVRAIPTDTITGTIRVIGVAHNNRMVEVTDTTVPISKGGTGAANVAGAKSNLGLNNVENKSSATIRSELTQDNVNNALGTGSGTTMFYREDGTWATPADSNTTYTFANGTNGFTVTPSNGVAQTVTVTPSVDLSAKADKADTVLNTTLSRGRKASTTVGEGSFAFGNDVEASGELSFAIGTNSKASGKRSRAYGYGTQSSANDSHAEGSNTYATATAAHSEGSSTRARGSQSHAEGYMTYADGNSSHAEGSQTSSTGHSAHSEGYASVAGGSYSHAEGGYVKVYGTYAHAFGKFNVFDVADWESGKSYAVNDFVAYNNVLYKCKTANSDSSFDGTKWTSGVETSTVAEIVGGGDNVSSRKNIRLLKWNGNEYLKGSLYINCNDDSTGGTAVLPKGATWGALAGASGY